jgi:hypothetical protein
MRIRLTLVPAMTLVFACVLATSAGQATAMPAGKQTKIQNCENAIIDAQQDFLGRELGVFSTCAKDFLFANIKDSPAKEAALAAAKTACVAQLNTLKGASSTFIDSVIAGCTPAVNLIFTKPSDPTGYQDLLEELGVTDIINTVPELAGYLCASKTLFAVLIAAYEVPRGAQLFTNYVTNELHKSVTDFLDPRCTTVGTPPPKQ